MSKLRVPEGTSQFADFEGDKMGSFGATLGKWCMFVQLWEQRKTHQISPKTHISTDPQSLQQP